MWLWEVPWKVPAVIIAIYMLLYTVGMFKVLYYYNVLNTSATHLQTLASHFIARQIY